MHSSRTRIIAGIAIFAVALGATLLVASNRGGAASKDSSPAAKGAGQRDGGTPIAPLSIGGWDVKIGDTWAVNVTQDAGGITPDGASKLVKIPYRFEVTGVPGPESDIVSMHVAQDGAEGPFANGWNLQYQVKGATLVLSTVAMGEDKALEAELAAIVLGQDFPYEVAYTKRPAPTTTYAQDKLIARSALPPQQALPKGDGSNGAVPPSGAPSVPPSDLPSQM